MADATDELPSPTSEHHSKALDLTSALPYPTRLLVHLRPHAHQVESPGGGCYGESANHLPAPRRP
jgi:hypothetical protein